MILPLIFNLKVDCPQGGNLSGLLFMMRVTSGSKNPYHIYFPKTSDDGRSQLTAESFRGQFKDHGETFIMDFNGSVESASDVVVFELYDSRLMKEDKGKVSRWPLSKYEKTVWHSRKEFMDYFISCSNPEFEFEKQSIRIPVDGAISLTVNRKVQT
jgi:hypothetical protein